MGQIVTRETPVGELVPTCSGDTDYPAVEIRLKPKDGGDDILLGVIEYDKHDDTLNWLRWPNLTYDDADPVRFSMTKAEILEQLKARKQDS